MWQPGWEGSLGENGYMYMCDWVPSLSNWNSRHCKSAILQYKINLKNWRIILGFAGTRVEAKRWVQVAEMKVVKYDLIWNMSWRYSQQTQLVGQMWGVKIMELIFIEMNSNSFSKGNQRIFIQNKFKMPIKYPGWGHKLPVRFMSQNSDNKVETRDKNLETIHIQMSLNEITPTIGT